MMSTWPSPSRYVWGDISHQARPLPSQSRPETHHPDSDQYFYLWQRPSILVSMHFHSSLDPVRMNEGWFGLYKVDWRPTMYCALLQVQPTSPSHFLTQSLLASRSIPKRYSQLTFLSPLFVLRWGDLETSASHLLTGRTKTPSGQSVPHFSGKRQYVTQRHMGLGIHSSMSKPFSGLRQKAGAAKAQPCQQFLNLFPQILPLRDRTSQ